MRCPRWGEDKGLKDQEREHLRKIQGLRQREVKFEVSWAGKDKGWWFFMGRVPGTTWAEQRARSRGRAELSWDTSPGTRSLVLFLQTQALSPSLWDFPGAAPTPRLILHPSLRTGHPQPLGTGDQHDPPQPPLSLGAPAEPASCVSPRRHCHPRWPCFPRQRRMGATIF